MFALAFVFLIGGLLAVAVDLSQLYEARVRLADAAEQAAIAGASQVVVGPGSAAESGGPPQLLPDFQAVCAAAGDAMSAVRDTTTSCSTAAGTTNEVEARVSARVPVMFPVPGEGGSITVTATFAAAPVLGGQGPVG